MSGTNKDAVKIFLVEDHPVMRLGLKMMLEEHGFNVCGEAETLREAFARLPEANADIAIFDLSLNGETAFDGITQVRQQKPGLGLIIYSMHDTRLFVEQALQIGVNAYVTKADPVETLVDAVNAVVAGKKFLGPTLAKTLEDRIIEQSGHVTALRDLSSREIEVLTLLGQGFGNREIAAQLALSHRTVETYLTRLKDKLGVTSSRELSREAIKITHSG
ncbi:MAG: response regulator transcription factor [Candidatus Riflebacteria bacterium]|nr:response regulator transcription factor [Candidatus Riflebacteria bacterium]